MLAGCLLAKISINVINTIDLRTAIISFVGARRSDKNSFASFFIQNALHVSAQLLWRQPAIFNPDFIQHHLIIYIKPWYRIGPYIVGLLLGYHLAGFHAAAQKKTRSLQFMIAGWTIAAAAGFWALYGLYPALQVSGRRSRVEQWAASGPNCRVGMRPSIICSTAPHIEPCSRWRSAGLYTRVIREWAVRERRPTARASRSVYRLFKLGAQHAHSDAALLAQLQVQYKQCFQY